MTALFIPTLLVGGRRWFVALRGPVQGLPGTELRGRRRRIRKVMRRLPFLLASPRRQARFVARDLAHLSDEALVALVARSDEVALAELYERYGRVAYGLARRILRDDDLAQDAVQEGFLAAWRSAARFMPERAKASTWLLTLVHRRAVDLVRREERRRAEPLEEAPVAEAAGTDEAVWLRLERERVQSALRALPDQQREALELAYYGGFTQSELADRLGQPIGTIKSRMFTGLGRLRELLSEPESERKQWTPTHSTS
jgi:RNA polymerase sigma factor (sigma-70 family)